MLHFINQNGHKITDFELGYCFIYFSPAKVHIDSDPTRTWKMPLHTKDINIWFAFKGFQ